MRRIMCVWFPRLPLDRRARLGDPRIDGPFAIISEVKNAFRLISVSPKAEAGGVTAGMSVADARSILPELVTELSDPLREAMLLRTLMRWAGSLSPWVASMPPDRLVIDISGCSHLFGGEQDMAQHTQAQLADMQIVSRIGIADTKRAACALARYHTDDIFVSGPGETRTSIRPLPIAALDIPLELTHDLRRTGLKTIGQLYDHRSSELARRFGLDLPQILSKALGHTPDPICPEDPDKVFAARMNLPMPIGLQADVDAVLEKLCASVCGRLRKAQRGARQFNLTIRCVDSGDHVISIGFASPTYDQGAIRRQFERPLDELRIDYGADWFRLIADSVEPIRVTQTQILADHDDPTGDISQLITTLGNRLGFDKVRRYVPCDSHLPDYDFTTIEAVESEPVTEWPAGDRERPLHLFRPERLRTLTPGRPPKAFEWRRRSYDILHAAGPERLSPEWWRSTHEPVRDYWRVMTESGDRLWLLSYPGVSKPNWYVTGRFA